MKAKKGIIIFIKAIIIAFSLLFIGHRIFIEYQSGVLVTAFQKMNGSSLILFTLALALVWINWFIEALKWKHLLLPLQVISNTEAIKSVFAGISVSIFTPNRVGEFGGRVLFIRKRVRIQGIFATLIGNIAQTLITIVSGLLFFPFFMHKYDVINQQKEMWILFLAILAVIAGFVVYFNLKRMAKWFESLQWVKNRQPFFNFMLTYSSFELVKFLGLSLLRYLVFTFQFYLLLSAFGVHISYISAIMSISLVYFLMTFIPTFALSELGVRGSVAVLIIGVLSPQAMSILASSLTLWVINLAVPALIGTIYLSKSDV